jgi:glycosyltransferase involved in cell wall biosynthesis
MKKKIINLIQDNSTPHNNVLIAAFNDCHEAQIKLWYAMEMDKGMLQGNTNILHEKFSTEIYGNSLNWRFLKYCFSHPEEKFVIVGWRNINTRLIYVLFFLLRRPFNHWTDLPNPKLRGIKHKCLRWFAYKLLKYSNSKIFGVGEITLNKFRILGFSAKRLVNLPIFVAVDEDLPAYHAKLSKLREQYAINPQSFLISAGSRLIHEKGYDILIKAIRLLDSSIRQNIKVVIVGRGECLPKLERLVIDLNLSEQIVMEGWLHIDDFKTLIANSDIFIHPSRFDAYGGTILGMALGVAVIGSNSAGAAIDRIDHGRNGFLYDAEDTQSLANFITFLYQNPEFKRRMGVESYKTASQWPPRRGLDIILDNAI